MIGFFIKSGGKKASEEFSRYIFGDSGINHLFKESLSDHYSDDLKLILIKLYVDGEIVNFPTKQKVLSNYSSKTKSIAVDCFIKAGNFFDKKEGGRKEEIGKIILNALELVEGRMNGRGISMNWDLFRDNVRATLREWRGR